MKKLTNLIAIAAVSAAALLPAPALASRQSPPDTRFKVVLARVVTTSGRQHLLLRVKGPAKTVKVRIVLARSSGKMIAAFVRTVRTNRRVLVPRLVIPPTTRRLHVRILGHVG